MAIGWKSPEHTRDWEVVLWPVLGILLYSTFTQVPLIHLTSAFRDRRFLAALLTGNFVLLPVIVGALLLLLPDDPAIRLGVLLVLVVTCSHWYLWYAQIGGGDIPRAHPAAAVQLRAQPILQLVTVRLYL